MEHTTCNRVLQITSTEIATQTIINIVLTGFILLRVSINIQSCIFKVGQSANTHKTYVVLCLLLRSEILYFYKEHVGH